MRGKEKDGSCSYCIRGITPAYAGKRIYRKMIKL